MTAPFTDGRLRASGIRTWLPITAFTTTDLGVASTLLFAEVPGLAVYLEANRKYAIDGFIAYAAAAGSGAKFAMIGPAGAYMNWSLNPVSHQLGGTGIGISEATRATADGEGSPLSAAGGTAIFCAPHGEIETYDVPGLLSVRVTQNSSNATETVVRRGSWLRAERIA